MPEFTFIHPRLSIRCQCRGEPGESFVFRMATDTCKWCGRGICSICGTHAFKRLGGTIIYRGCRTCIQIIRDTEKEVIVESIREQLQSGSGFRPSIPT